MKLLKFKLLSDYKIFKKGFKISFEKDYILVVTGLNGSGKSILFEMILKTFINSQDLIRSKLENQNLKFDRENEKQELEFDFNIEYLLSTSNIISYFVKEQIEEIGQGNVIVYISYSNKKISFEVRSELTNKLLIKDKFEIFESFLPNKIVAYSSGQNETLSWPIYKYNIKRFSYYYREMLKDNMTYIEDKKFIFLDEKYKYSNLITNLIFNLDKLQKINSVIGIKQIKSYMFDLELKDQRKREIKLPADKEFLIKKLIGLSKVVPSTNYRITCRYDLNINNTKKIEEEFMGNSKSFFNILEFMEDINLYKIRPRQLNMQHNKNENGFRKICNSYVDGRKVFEIYNVKVETYNNLNININDISDGEFQLLQIVGAICIYDDDNTLFLFDEPESHFNSKWRANFVDYISSLINKKSQIIFTTHNLEILTDIRKEYIYLLENGNIQNIQMETFGTNTTLIGAELFKKGRSISNVAYRKYKEYVDQIKESNIQNLNKIEEDILSNFGDSAERILLFYEINRRREK